MSRETLLLVAWFLFGVLIGLGYVLLQPDGLKRLKRFMPSANESSAEVFIASGAPQEDDGAVMFSPDGKMIAAADGSTLNLRDAATGQVIYRLKGHSGSIKVVAFSPDSKAIVSGSSDKSLRLWNASNGREIRSFSGHHDEVSALAFSPDGKTIASGSYDHTLKLWDANSGRELNTLEGPFDKVIAVTFTSDGKNVFSFYKDKNLKVWDVASGQELRTLKVDSGWSERAAFSPDRKTLALVYYDSSLSGDNDRILHLWDVASGQKLRTFKSSDWLYGIAFSPDSKTIVSTGSKLITLWDATQRTGWLNLWGLISGSGREFQPIDKYIHSAAVAFSPDGRKFATGSRLYNAQTGQEIARMVGFEDGEWVTVTPEGYYIASKGGEKYLNVRVDDQVYGIDHFKPRFHRPDIVKLALELGDTQKAIVQLAIPAAVPVASVVSPQAAAQSAARIDPTTPPIRTGPRLALVIGNINYPGQHLINPVNDADDMEQVLKQLGFSIRRYNNLDLQKLSEAISAFMDELRRNPNAVALFYYAGHGAEVAGVGYLLPIAHGITQEVDVPYRAYPIAQVMDNLKAAHQGVNIVIVDACRNNPFGRNSLIEGRSRGSSVSRGLQRVNQVPLGSLIASSTSSGDVADDGAYGRNSPYTKHLKVLIQQPGWPVERVFREVRKKVLEETHNKQVPWESTYLTDEFYFVPIGKAN